MSDKTLEYALSQGCDACASTYGFPSRSQGIAGASTHGMLDGDRTESTHACGIVVSIQQAIRVGHTSGYNTAHSMYA